MDSENPRSTLTKRYRGDSADLAHWTADDQRVGALNDIAHGIPSKGAEVFRSFKLADANDPTKWLWRMLWFSVGA